MPDPKKGESKADFIERCIPFVLQEGTTDDQKQAVAICHSIWDESQKEKKSSQEGETPMAYYDAGKVERRCLPAAELRIAEESPKITGYAAVFNTWADIGGWFRESIKPGAFRKTLMEADIRALWNHDPNYVLARNKAGTLRLREDDKGLAVEIDPVDSLWANDLVKSMKRGDVNQMSFGFTVNKEEIDQAKDERVLIDVTLFDVSVVTYPAYPTTSAQVRAAFQKTITTSSVAVFDPSAISWSDGSGTYNPPGHSELDRIVRKLIRKEDLTEEELRVVSAHYPDLSPPAASHAETPTPPAASHAVDDTRKGDPVAELLIRASRMLSQTTPQAKVRYQS